MATSDPGAEYAQTTADLNQGYSNEIASIGENENNLVANTGLSEKGLGEQEPGVYKGEANRANKGNILTSGANAGRKATIAGSFAEKRLVNQTKLGEGKAGYTKQREMAGQKKEAGYHTAGQRRLQGEEEYRANHPTIQAANPGAPANPGATRVLTGPAGAGGVVPYTETLKNGAWVRIGGRKS